MVFNYFCRLFDDCFRDWLLLARRELPQRAYCEVKGVSLG